MDGEFQEDSDDLFTLDELFPDIIQDNIDCIEAMLCGYYSLKLGTAIKFTSVEHALNILKGTGANIFLNNKTFGELISEPYL